MCLKFSTHFFNMHYTFQHMLKCSTCFFMFSTHAEIFNTLFQHVFNMCYRFQHALKFSILFFNMFSTCVTDFNSSEIFNTLFQHVFNMHYRFQHALKFSTHFFNMFSTHFKHENLKHLQSTETHPEICVQS